MTHFGQNAPAPLKVQSSVSRRNALVKRAIPSSRSPELSIRIAPGSASVNDTVNVSCKVQNTGKLKGKETVQLYIRDTACKVLRPDKELKAFTKVELLPGQQKEIRFELNRDAFAYFSTALNQWHVEEGDVEFLIGASSRDIRLTGKVYIRNGQDFS